MTSASLGPQNKHVSFPQTFPWEPQELKRQELWLLKLTSCNQRCCLPCRAAPESPPLLDTHFLTCLKKRSPEMAHLSRSTLKEPTSILSLSFWNCVFFLFIQQLTLPTPSSDRVSLSFYSKNLHLIESRPDWVFSSEWQAAWVSKGSFPVAFKFISRNWFFFQIVLHAIENSVRS